MKVRHLRNAFTLVELLVVVAIIGILIGICELHRLSISLFASDLIDGPFVLGVFSEPDVGQQVVQLVGFFLEANGFSTFRKTPFLVVLGVRNLR